MYALFVLVVLLLLLAMDFFSFHTRHRFPIVENLSMYSVLDKNVCLIMNIFLHKLYELLVSVLHIWSFLDEENYVEHEKEIVKLHLVQLKIYSIAKEHLGIADIRTAKFIRIGRGNDDECYKNQKKCPLN